MTKEYVDLFLNKIRSGEINPDMLMDMSSKERHSYFAEFLGEENAKHTNALFESKLLLKNQQQGIINWAKTVGGIKPEVQRDILSKVNRMTEVLQPEDADAFYSDLAAQKLGINVTMEEASHIVALSKKVSEAKSKMNDDHTFSTDSDRISYGASLVHFGNYVASLKLKAMELPIKAYAKPENWGKVLSALAGNAKAIKASFDNSAIFRQGWKTLWTNPVSWQKNAIRSFVDIYHELGGKEVMDGIMADIYSRPNALNGMYKKEKLAIGTIEEAFPTHWPRRIPIVGRIYKASETAYTGFVYRQRVDIFDKYVEIAHRSGADTKGIGKVVNALTGRGHLGALEPSASVFNNIFFSPRLLKSNIDLLTAHATDKNMGKFAREQAAVNLLKVVGGTAAVLTIANVMRPGSVEWNPQSADFGKIRIGDTRFDVTGGLGALVTLAWRLITMHSKSSTTGKVTDLRSGKYGEQTATDVVYNFFENKLSPAAAFAKDILKGTTFNGKKVTVGGELYNLFMPLTPQTAIEVAQNPNGANAVIAVIVDALGISVNTYSGKTMKDIDDKLSRGEITPMQAASQKRALIKQQNSIKK